MTQVFSLLLALPLKSEELKLPLNAQLIAFLLARGYIYVLSKTKVDQTKNPDIFILLTPVPEEPLIEALPEHADTYYAILEEPVQMAEGIDEVSVAVELPAEETRLLKQFLLGFSIPTLVRNSAPLADDQAFGSRM